MKIKVENIDAIAERYLNNELSPSENLMLQNALNADKELKSSWEETIHILNLFKEQQKRKNLKKLFHQAKTEFNQAHSNKLTGSENKVIAFWNKFGMKAAVAAALVLASSLTTFFFMKDNTEQSSNQYMLLRREMETIKHSQNKIWDSIRTKDLGEEINPALYGGTGFAITNDGYVATNYHVVKEANSIYIQTADGRNQKAYLMAFDPKADIALLKVEDQEFKFSKNNLPYSFANHTSGLGQRVFSMGYPQDDLVYNEGYISCENGFEGDSTSYQLEMVANPGQSGAPVLDKFGNVIAIITGKQSNTPGKTFAVHTEALIHLIASLPTDMNIKINTSSNKLKTLDRTQQVSSIRDYVCSVKVN